MSAKKQASKTAKGKTAAGKKAKASPQPEEATLPDAIKAILEMPAEVQRFAVLFAALNMTDEKRDSLLLDLAESIRKRAIDLGKQAGSYAAELGVMADEIQKRREASGGGIAADARIQECCDESLAFLMRNDPGLDRATRSESQELTSTACGAMHETGAFLRALRRNLELAEDASERGDILRYFANHVHTLAEGMAELIDEYPEAAKGIGGDFPNWPFLMFKRDKRHPLPEDMLRQADLIGLGDTCAVNPSPRRNWTALQKYLFEIFRQRQSVKRFVESNTRTADFNTPLHWLLLRDGRTPSEIVKLCLAEHPERPEESITDAEAELFLESFKLPPFKSGKEERESRKVWAERFLVPLIDIREPDLKAVPAFETRRKHAKAADRDGELAAIKEGVIKALETMTRDGKG